MVFFVKYIDKVKVVKYDKMKGIKSECSEKGDGCERNENV